MNTKGSVYRLRTQADALGVFGPRGSDWGAGWFFTGGNRGNRAVG